VRHQVTVKGSRRLGAASVAFVRRGGAGLAAVGLVAGSFVGLSATAASAATSAFTMTMNAGEFGVHSNPPATLPPPGSLAGSEDHTTGAISGATLALSPYHTTNTGSTETIFIRQVTAGAATGLISYTGTLRVTDTLSALITIRSPVTRQCLSQPIHVNLTGHYDSTTHTATISQTNFTIPNFPTTSPAGRCTLASTALNSRFAGSTGNVMSLTLQGTLVLPPPPAAPTTTTLSVAPPSPVLAGTSVTLTATVTSGGQLATQATGTVKFMAGSTQIGATQTLATGKASVTSSSLPTVTGQQLTAVYSGDAKYAASTSVGQPYVVQPRPTVGLSTTTLSATRGSTTPMPFSVVITNPTTGEGFASVWLQLRMNGTSGLESSQVTLSYENSAQVWCPITLSGRKKITGTFKGTGGACNSAPSFALPADGQPMVIPFEVSYAADANLGTQTFVVSLLTVSGSTVVPPFTTATVTTVPVNAPYAKGTLTVVPATKLTVTVLATPPTSAIPEGYVLPVFPIVLPPATTTTNTIYYPSATGTATFLIDGHVTSTSPGHVGTITFTETKLSTATLAPGSHTLEVKYNGSNIYNAGHYTTTFTVTTAAPGTAFVCSSSLHPVIVASVVASGTLPATSNTTQATISNLGVVLHADSSTGPNAVAALSTVSIGLSPGGSVTGPGLTPTKSGGITTASWTGLSGTVTTINGAPDTVVPVAVTSLSFVQSGRHFSCTANPTPVALGSVTVSGVMLAGNPASPVTAGTAVTLTATVGPAANGGQVNFLEVHGTTTTNIGTVPVSNGTAALVVTPTTGAHTYRATWAGIAPVAVSNTLIYTVTAAPVITTQPANQTVDAGQSASFSAAASGTPAPTVQWQLSTNGSTWSTITGATGTTYAIASTTSADSGHQFRAVFTNSVSTATTNAASLVVVSPPVVVTQPANQSVQSGTTATFSAKATGTVLVVQWQVSTDGGGSWSNAAGTPKNTFASATTLTSAYTTPPTATANNGNQYRAVFSNGIGTANSNAAALTVTATPPPPPPPAPPAPPVPPVTTGGYHLVAANGSVYSYGNAPFYGSMGGQTLNKPIVGTASTPGDGGYWLVASDGGIFSFGNAAFYGSMGGKPLNQPIVGIAATPDGQGYWEVASDGGIFAFGDAAFYGSMGAKPLNKPIVGIASTPDGKGYWEVASDGGIFAFGTATFYGSTGSLTLNKPIVGMASTSTGGGYWLVAQDGGVFSFGNAGFHGTVAGTTSAQIVSLVPTGDNGGYWETASNGQVFQFGDATSAGTALAQTATIVAMSD
jgi:hypothetical protein